MAEDSIIQWHMPMDQYGSLTNWCGILYSLVLRSEKVITNDLISGTHDKEAYTLGLGHRLNME